MPIFLSFDDPTFVQRFEDILNSDRNDNLDVNRVVIDILADVKTRGDEAILELTHRFDKIELDKEDALEKAFKLILTGVEVSNPESLHIRGKVKYFTHGNYAVELTDK